MKTSVDGDLTVTRRYTFRKSKNIHVKSREMRSILLSLCLFGLAISPIVSYSIELSAGKTECFYLTSYDVKSTIYGSFEVISTDPKPIVVVVKGPKMIHFQSEYKDTGETLTEEEQEALDKSLSEGSFSFDSEVEGDFSLCLSNGNSENNDGLSRIVAFNYRISTVIKNKDYEYSGIESELSDLKEGLNRLKDHQSYMNQREDVHKVVII